MCFNVQDWTLCASLYKPVLPNGPESLKTSMKGMKELPGVVANPCAARQLALHHVHSAAFSHAECVTVHGFAFTYSGSCNGLRNRVAQHPLSIAHEA